MNTATEVRKLTNMHGDASLYKLSEPLDGNEYVVVSALKHRGVTRHDLARVAESSRRTSSLPMRVAK